MAPPLSGCSAPSAFGELGLDDRLNRVRAAVILLLAAFALRGWDFGNPVVHVDEQYYLLVGDRMLHGAVPYVDLWDRKPVGLFLIYAAMRLLPGEGIFAYQVVATLFAAATAMLVARGARMFGAGRMAALGAGFVYLVWLPLLSGRGGQSPVFYDLFMTGAALLTLRLPGLSSPRAIVANGAAACLLAGLAIQTKYTPFVEGAFFGAVHLWYLRRAGARWIVPAALLWVTLGVLPTALVVIDYAFRAPAVFDAFWFSNFGSVQLRKGYPAAKIVGRLSGTWAQLAPLVLCAATTARKNRTVRISIILGWLAAGLVAYAMIGAFFDHYALPLVAPLAMLSAPTFERRSRVMAAVLAAGMAVLIAKAATRGNDAAGARMLGRVVGANDAGGCPYVFAGDSVTYFLAHACTPTRYAFPSTLAYAPESGASGVDEAAEVRRIMASSPPVVVTLAKPLAPWNPATHAIVADALARDYRPVFRTPREDTMAIVWLRRDRRFVRPL